MNWPIELGDLGPLDDDPPLAKVCWKSRVTGATGHGSPLPKPVAKLAAERGNSMVGDVAAHWTEDVDSVRPTLITEPPAEDGPPPSTACGECLEDQGHKLWCPENM